MKTYNLIMLYAFVSGCIAIIIGALHKINGNPNAFYALWAGITLSSVAALFFMYWNYSSLKKVFNLFK